MVCDLSYGDGGVERVVPVAFGAYNDCSIRRPGAKKISEKKNWGAATKGVSREFLSLEAEGIDPEGITGRYRLACLLHRDGQFIEYGIDSALPDYSYYGDQLLEWLVDRLRNQLGSEETPLEDVGSYLEEAGRPARMLVGIGATRYTGFGESHYLREGDESIVAVYPGASSKLDQLVDALARGELIPGGSLLRQRVTTAG